MNMFEWSHLASSAAPARATKVIIAVMATIFSLPPEISRNQINRAGNVLISSKNTESAEYVSALDILSKWRSCHAYPINTFQATLRRKLESGFGSHPLVAQRLKRAKTIVDKLRDLPDMQLARMQDIGGVRAIVATIDDVRKLEAEYRDGSRFAHELYGDGKDYIAFPKKDGYRSVHLVFKYKNPGNPGKKYDGLLVELQIRTKMQHSWATALETIQKFQGIAIKTREGTGGARLWQEFFSGISSAFAHMEATPLVPGYENLPANETFKIVSKRAKELKVIDRLKAYRVAVRLIGQRRSSHYHLIVLDTSKKLVFVTSYGRDESKRANADYSKYEKKMADGEPIDPVLVGAGPLSATERAYSSFFSKTDDFIENLRSVITAA